MSNAFVVVAVDVVVVVVVVVDNVAVCTFDCCYDYRQARRPLGKAAGDARGRKLKKRKRKKKTKIWP